MLINKMVCKQDKALILLFCFIVSASNLITVAKNNTKLAEAAGSSKALKGKIEHAHDLDTHGEVEFSSDRAHTDPKAPEKEYLKGSAQIGDLDAAKEDPDADDKELMIAWDHWRNKFLQAVLASTSEMLNSDQARSFQINPQTHVMEPKYPIGTTAWFVCEVTRERQIKRLRILNSSGFADYDQAVLDAVQALQGSSLLRFPTGSRRVAVLQGGAVERASQAQKQYFRFGDVERYRVPGY